MSKYKPQQRHLTILGREYHFVSYEGHSANRRNAQPADPAMWYLMVEGRRCPVVPCDPTLSPEELDTVLAAWVASNALGPAPSSARVVPVDRTDPAVRRWADWW
jgi:hypothetical protein